MGDADPARMRAILAPVLAPGATWAAEAEVDPDGLAAALAGGWAESWGHPELGPVITLTPWGADALAVELDERWGWSPSPAGPGWVEEPRWADAGRSRHATDRPPPGPSAMRPLPRWMDPPDPGPSPLELAIAAEEEARKAAVLVDDDGIADPPVGPGDPEAGARGGAAKSGRREGYGGVSNHAAPRPERWTTSPS